MLIFRCVKVNNFAIETAQQTADTKSYKHFKRNLMHETAEIYLETFSCVVSGSSSYKIIFFILNLVY